MSSKAQSELQRGDQVGGTRQGRRRGQGDASTHCGHSLSPGIMPICFLPAYRSCLLQEHPPPARWQPTLKWPHAPEDLAAVVLQHGQAEVEVQAGHARPQRLPQAQHLEGRRGRVTGGKGMEAREDGWVVHAALELCRQSAGSVHRKRVCSPACNAKACLLPAMPCQCMNRRISKQAPPPCLASSNGNSRFIQMSSQR